MTRKNNLFRRIGKSRRNLSLPRFFIALSILLLTAGASLFANAQADNGSGKNTAVAQEGKAKYVFLFIGDGMAMTQISSAEIYATARSSKDIAITRLSFTRLPVSGITTTYDAGTFITDSASAITAIATGNKTLSGVLNMDPGKTRSYKTIAEYAHDAGMKVGVVTSVTLDHATPAGFYAKAPSRSNYYDIAGQMVKSGFDYFAGGGLLEPRGKNKDQPDVIQAAQNAGYAYVNSKAAFNALKPGAGKVLAINAKLQDAGSMPYELDRKADDLSLADYTRKGIELLQDAPKGFFLTVEGGKIDWACHANDAGAAIHDVIAFDNAVKVALDFARVHQQETLIIVTGDHETGGMTIGFAGTQYDTFFDKVALQKKTFIAFNDEVLAPYKKNTPRERANLADLLPSIKDAFGVDYAALSDFQKQQLEFAFQRTMGGEIERPVAEDQYLLYGGYEPLTVKITQLMNQTAGIGWTSYAHTGVPVTTFAAGVHQELFSGYYDNTDIFRKMASAMNLEL
ncbi:MAG: alkaline phosphatase [Treponema sp.]|nr:alkaline phosphatase [Treponema sp.]